MNAHVSPSDTAAGLYTAEERVRRDNSVWTLVQGILAPIQFLVFAISVGLIAHWWLTGEWLVAAHVSVVIKTLTLYAIMITGSIWEKEVFGAYLFARPFFWEDMVSMLVLALHTAYLAALFGGLLGDGQLMALAVAAYVSYVINAGQFLYKFRLARLDAPSNARIGAAA
ncbi:MAG: 2-vinyl bacteriochlorophyllide hydratase [Hoeflea sp.]|uniref:2-vinyl bacteriochlorophyllide hydratase n=1 Tax=Hoeflea sp. TaxID=1940281 RepID=UPI0032EB8A84